MKKTVLPVALLLGVGVFFTACDRKSTTATPNNNNNNNNHNIDTSTNVVMIPDMDSTTFALPTAFSPNGDGKNDSYGALASHPDKISSYALSVYEGNGTLVFHTDSIQKQWDGKVNGVVDTTYRYAVQVSFTTTAGTKFNASSFLFLLPTSQTPQHCTLVKEADLKKYIFGDQIDVITGTRPYASNEQICLDE